MAKENMRKYFKGLVEQPRTGDGVKKDRPKHVAKQGKVVRKKAPHKMVMVA